MKPTATFLDFVQIACARRKLDQIWPDRHAVQREATARLDQLARAQRFRLDDEATGTIERFSMEQLPRILASLPHWLPPFDLIWLEHDPKARMLASGGDAAKRVTGGEPLPEGIGLLLERVANRPATYSLQPVTRCWHGDAPVDTVSFNFAQWLIDFADEPEVLTVDAMVEEQQLLMLLPFTDDYHHDARSLPALGMAAGEFGASHFFTDAAFCATLNRRVTARLSPYQRFGMAHIVGSGFLDREPAFADMLRQNIMEAAGLLRFVVGALALLATQAAGLREGGMAGRRGHRLVGGKRLPFFGYREIHLQVPAGRVARRFLGIARASAAKRRHEVQGHWCHDAVAKAPCAAGTGHVWAPWPRHRGDGPPRYRCTVCGGRRWRREAHERGDASLGWVYQDRVVEAETTCNPQHGER